MNQLLKSVFCCPISKGKLSVLSLQDGQNEVLYCNVSNTFVPIINGISYFNERSIFISKEDCLIKINDLENKCGSNSNEYREFVKQKSRRAYNDAYAAFQPFNEASKAFYPFIDGLRKMLQPNDIILDIWNRTGWSTTFLASIFPEQHIISIWDRNKDVLGYKGYNFWFAKESMPANVSVIFTDLNSALPFQDNSIGLVYAMDTLHHFPLETYLPELLRVSKKEGSIIFPHVHMANNDPSPFFERGGLQLHGETYQTIFNKMLPLYHKKAFVYSEPYLFKLKSEEALQSMPSTSDYNGCIALLPEHQALQLKPFKLSHEALCDARLIINPFLKIDYVQSKITLDRNHFEGSVGHIIDRHPVYDDMLSKNDGASLTEKQIRLLYFGSKGNTIKEIAKILDDSMDSIQALATDLQSKDIVELLPIDETGFRLQHFHGSQDYITSKESQTLNHLWQQATQEYAEKTLLISEFDESEINYGELAEIVNLISERFQKNGISKGEKIAVYAPISPEATMLFWASMQNGIIYIPISHLMPQSQVEAVIEQYEIKLLFTNKDLEIDALQILLDSFEIESNKLCFSDWLDADNLLSDFDKTEINTTDEAVILFTSGSTGHPKGVIHSHGSLFRSGRLITENFHWQAKDKYLASADLDSMSGLRNCVIAPLHVGASITIPNTEQRQHAVAISELIKKEQITIISTTPTLLRQWLLMGRRIRASLSSVNYIMCTGSNLSETLMVDFEATMNIPILNYYGLTETCGICIAVNKNDVDYSKTSIGRASGSVIQVVDNHNEVVPTGEEGNLRILTENVFLAYYQNEEAYKTMVQNNWLYTGDTATIDANGWVNLMGRKRDIIKNTRGDLIYPIEIEEFIQQSNLVKDVHVCAQLKDDMEYIVAFIALEDATNEANKIELISNDIKEKLGEGKVPKIFKTISELPYNTNGKINRSKLIEAYL